MKEKKGVEKMAIVLWGVNAKVKPCVRAMVIDCKVERLSSTPEDEQGIKRHYLAAGQGTKFHSSAASTSLLNTLHTT